MRAVLLLVAIVISAIGLSVCAFAQEIHGTVTDPSGAVVPRATLHLNSGTTELAVTTTDQRGRYAFQFSVKRCAECVITCAATGFIEYRKTITLEENHSLVLPIQLAIDVAAENVSVSGVAEPLRERLDSGEVRESSAKDLGEALTDLDGVSKIRKAGIANDIVVRGFQQNNINVSIDGARVYGACPGHMDPSVQHVDFAEVDHVELERGAFDVTSSGSLGALVRIVTKKPPTGVRFTPSLATGSFGFYNPSATASLGRDRFRALVGYSYRTSEPYRDGTGKSFLTYTNFSDSAQGKRAFDIHTGWFESEYRPTDRQKIAIAYTRQQSGLILYPYLTMDSDYDNADRGSLNYEIQDVGSLRALRIQSYFTQVVHFMSDTYRTTAMMNSWMMASNARSRVFGGRAEADAGKNLMLGVEGYYRNWNLLGYMNMGGMLSANPSLPDVGTTAVGGFISYRRSITDRLRLTAGARFDHDSMAANAANLNTNAYYNYQGTRSTTARDNYGSGNVRISYTLAKDFELFAGAGTTGRIPDAEERYINRASMTNVNVGNPKLPIVRNTEATAGLLFNRSASFVRPTLFYSSIGDYIIVNNQPLLSDSMGPATARSYTNVAARIYGAEVSYGVALPRGFSLNGGASYSRGTNDRKPLAGVFSTSLSEIPPLRAWAALRYAYRYTFTEIGSTAVARQNLVSHDLKESPTPGYALMHLKFGLAYRRLYASVVADNLLNRYYYEHLSYYRDPFRSGVRVPEPGRNLFIQLKYDLGQ